MQPAQERDTDHDHLADSCLMLDTGYGQVHDDGDTTNDNGEVPMDE